MSKRLAKTAQAILKTADWKLTQKRNRLYITAKYKGSDVSICEDDSILVVKRRNKTIKKYDVGNTEEFESLFGLFWGF